MQNKNSNLTPILIIIIIAIAFSVISIFAFKAVTSSSNNHIIVEIYNADGTSSTSKKINYQKGNTLEQLLRQNYQNVVVQDGYLIQIDTLVEPKDKSYYIAIYVDDVYSDKGVQTIKLINGSHITLKLVSALTKQ